MTMRGSVFAGGKPCPLCGDGGKWDVIRDRAGDVVNIICKTHFTVPERYGVDGRGFKNRKGDVGRLTRDEKGELLYSFHAAKRLLESIRHDWDKLGSVRFDPTRWSRSGRESYKLSECAREWQLNMRDRGVKDSTIAHAEMHFRLHIIPILTDLDIREITEDDIERLQRELLRKEGLSGNTPKSILQSLSTMLRRYHERKHVLDRMPSFPEKWSALVYSERHEVTVPEQRRLMARLVMAYPKAERRSMLRLQKIYAALGCRPGEAHALKRRDILEDGKVMLQGAIDPRTGKWGQRKTKDIRVTAAPLPEKILAEIRSLPIFPNSFLCTDAAGEPFNQNRTSIRFTEICDIPTVTYYTYSKHSLGTRTAREAAEDGRNAAARRIGVTRKVLDGHYNLTR
jgi:integrase